MSTRVGDYGQRTLSHGAFAIYIDRVWVVISAAGVLWACGRLQVTPREGEADALLDCLLIDEGMASKARHVQPQALVHGVWGACHMEGVALSQKHRDAVLSHVSRLIKAGVMGTRHADALRASAAGAGLDPVQMEHVLTAGDTA